MSYACRILADSISPAGHRITSFEVTFPRIVLAEINTHCALSRNSASSRARPVLDFQTAAGETRKGTISTMIDDSFVPEAFGRNQKGMQPGEALEGDDDLHARMIWLEMRDVAAKGAAKLAEIGVHKQYANRLIEPFSWHTAVITATDWDNFFHLRCSPLAQGELRKAAELMSANLANSEPEDMTSVGWHTPYIAPEEYAMLIDENIDVAVVSAARCARVSYLTQNGKRDVAEDLALADRLLESGHMSPFEHVARPMTETELDWTESWDIAFDDGPTIRTRIPGREMKLQIGWKLSSQTVTHVRGPLHYSGKLNGWISRRAYVRGEHDILGHRTTEGK